MSDNVDVAISRPVFRIFMDLLIVVLLIVSIYNTNTARDANHRAAVVSAATAKVAVATADLAYQNCLTLAEGRRTANARNKNILSFVHFTSRLNPGFNPKDPTAIAYFKEADRLFGKQADLPEPKCVNPKTAIKP